MFRFGFFFLLGFSCLFLCEGAVFPPSNGTKLTFTPGSTEKIVWNFTDDIESFSYRLWMFTPSDGQQQVALAKINGDNKVSILTTSYEVAVEKPATLVLKNVNSTYNGTYRFSLSPNIPSDVFVYIAVKPKATASPNPIKVNEGDNVSCTCQGQGGNPPADVTWYKDNHKIGETGKEEKTLTLTNVTNGKDHKGYKCVAESHHNKMFQDEVKVEVRVRPKCKPYKTEIKVPEEAYIGEKLVINCFSDGLPAPSFTITHNVTNNIVCKHSRYVKENVDYSDAGMYKCIAKNVLGIDTDSDKLIVKVTKIEKRPSTKSATNVTTTQSTPSKITDGGSGVSPGAIAGICIAVLLLLVIVTVVYCCYKRKEKDARNRGNIHRPIGGNHYELDDEEAIEGDNAYDTLVAAASGSKSSAPEKDTPPPVYAAVDKENRLGNTLYASLDTDAMKPKRESKKERAERAPPADYASIDFAKTAKAAKAEPV